MLACEAPLLATILQLGTVEFTTVQARSSNNCITVGISHIKKSGDDVTIHNIVYLEHLQQF